MDEEASGAGWFLTSERLGFRPWTGDDLGLAVALWGDERVTRFIDSRGRLSVEQVRGRLLDALETQRTDGVAYWPMFRLDDGEHVGACGLKPREPAARVYEMGFHIRVPHWRRGYAAEAARAVIGYAFGILDAGALFAGHAPGNDPARALLTRLGFVHTHVELYPPTGLMHPSYRLERPQGPQPA